MQTHNTHWHSERVIFVKLVLQTQPLVKYISITFPQVQAKAEDNQVTLKVKIRDALRVNIYLLSLNSNKATLLGI